MAKNPRPVKYRRKIRLNIGLITFLIMFLYPAFGVYTYFTKDTVKFYEVVEGSLVTDTSHTGLILRTEEVQNAPSSGYINYYIREGKRAAVGTRIYTLDETGNLMSFLEENASNTDDLSSDNIDELKKRLSAFSSNFQNTQFTDSYDTKYMLDALVLEFSNLATVENLDEVMRENGINYSQITSPYSGEVSFNIDGFENTAVTTLTSADFNKSNYAIQFVSSGNLVESGAPVYKVVTSEDWKIVFELDDEEIEEYANRTTLSIYFPNKNLSLTGEYQTITTDSGLVVGELTFERYMVQFISERYVDFEIEKDVAKGLKIPATAVFDQSFYLLPVNFITTGGDGVESGFLKEVYSETGTSVEFITLDIYHETEDYYYVKINDSILAAGDYIVKTDTGERYMVGLTDVLQGVYNINKGYAVFKRIDIITSNNEYYTVKKNTKYGLNVYDHILLDPTDVSEGDFIYQ